MAKPIKIALQTEGANKAKGDLDDVAGKAGGIGTRLGKLKVPAAAVAGGLIALGGGLLKLAKGAAEDQKAQAVLAKTLKNTAGATDTQVKAVEDYISKTGKATGVTDDEMRPALANLVRSTKDVGKAQTLMGLAMDISAGTGKDLGAVSIALAKANNGQVGGLAKLGIQTKDASGKTKSFTQLQADLAKTFRGQAAAAANTAEGKFGRVKLQLAEMGETIGAKLLPTLSKLGDFTLTTVIPALERFGGWLERNHETFRKIGEVIAWLVRMQIGLVTALVRTGAKIAEVIGKIVAVSKTVGSFIGALPGNVTRWIGDTAKTLYQKGRGLIVGMLKGAGSFLSSVAGFFGRLPGSAARWIGNTARTLYQRGRGLVVGIGAGATSYLASVAGFFRRLPGSVLRWIGNTGRTLYQKGRGFLVGLGQGAGSYLGSVASFFGRIAGSAIRWIGDTGRTLYQRGRGLVVGIVSGATSYLGTLASKIGSIRGSAVRWLGDLGGLLRGAGQRLIQGLIDGISSKLQALRDKMAEVTGWIKAHLPGSPVKVGPLKSWNNGGAGKRLVDTIIAGLRARRTALQREISALSRIIDQGVALEQASAVPVLAAAEGGGGFGGVPAQVVLNVYALQDGPEVGRRVIRAIQDFERDVDGGRWRKL